MTTQAENSLRLYKGGNPATIKQLLQFQNSSVVNELKEHFGCNNISDLAVALANA